MITSTFTGNLGNHMWIYAVTRAVAEKAGYKWGFNPVPQYDYFAGRPQMSFMEIDYGITHNYTYDDILPCKYVWKEKYYNFIDYQHHPYQPDVFEVQDDTKLYIRCCQDARYLQDIKSHVANWFRIKKDVRDGCDSIIRENKIVFDNDLYVLNVRGGEYKGVPNLILPKSYWMTAIKKAYERNPNARFLCITDDIEYAQDLLRETYMPVKHFSIACDYYIINKAKNLILSNSSFAILPAWLNENNPFVFAPLGWARYGYGNKYPNWANSNIQTFGWNFIGKEDYEK